VSTVSSSRISLDQLAEAMKQMTPEQVEQLEIALAAA
jgi:hypothetical protein